MSLSSGADISYLIYEGETDQAIQDTLRSINHEFSKQYGLAKSILECSIDSAVANDDANHCNFALNEYRKIVDDERFAEMIDHVVFRTVIFEKRGVNVQNYIAEKFNIGPEKFQKCPDYLQI